MLEKAHLWSALILSHQSPGNYQRPEEQQFLHLDQHQSPLLMERGGTTQCLDYFRESL